MLCAFVACHRIAVLSHKHGQLLVCPGKLGLSFEQSHHVTSCNVVLTEETDKEYHISPALAESIYQGDIFIVPVKHRFFYEHSQLLNGPIICRNATHARQISHRVLWALRFSEYGHSEIFASSGRSAR